MSCEKTHALYPSSPGSERPATTRGKDDPAEVGPGVLMSTVALVAWSLRCPARPHRGLPGQGVKARSGRQGGTCASKAKPVETRTCSHRLRPRKSSSDPNRHNTSPLPPTTHPSPPSVRGDRTGWLRTFGTKTGTSGRSSMEDKGHGPVKL